MEEKRFRLIISNEKNSARVNMAIDEALINSFEENDMPILRFYSWEKSFTIGVGQKIDEYSYLNDYNKNYAKRVTGGGVLFHGHDLSYSLVLPRNYLKNYSIKESYEKICSFILEFYKDLGLNVGYAKDDENIELSKSKFCQVGFEAYDIVSNNLKLGGNAQRWTKKILFQHGSIPIKEIENSNFEQNIIGNTLTDFKIYLDYEKASRLLSDSFEKVFNIKLEKSLLNQKELEELARLLKDKYDYEK